MEGPGMTMESRQPEEVQSSSGLVPSSALSSADLWHEILGRLNEVQEGQLKLARAIESLGMIVCEALSVNPQAAIAGGEATALSRPPQRVSLAAGPSAPPTGEQVPVDAHDLAATQRTIDSLLGDDVFAPAEPARQMATAGSATSPRFYVAPVPEESRQQAREPVASGSWPRGRRVARGLAREAPPMTGPAIVPNLTPAAIDALLAAEFGEAPAPRNSPPPVVQAMGGGPLLNTLLGGAFEAVAPAVAPPSAPVNASATAPPAPSASAQPTFAPPPPPPPPPPMAPTRAPAMTQPTPAPSPLATPPPSVPSAPSPVAARLPQPPMAAPQSPPWSPTVDPRRSVGTPAPAAGAAAPPPVPPRTTPMAGPSPLLPPPVAPPAPSPKLGAVNPANVPDLPTGPDLSTAAADRSRPPFEPATANPAPFVASGLPASDRAPTGSPGSADPVPPMPGDVSPSPKRGDSAASMATEILSAAPRTPVVERTEETPTMLAEDVTIMAKGRRRRFRLR
jgi:hypothetical protein